MLATSRDWLCKTLNTPVDSSRFHVVKNTDHQCSIWPDYRRDTLPSGWSYVGFSGSREECLKHIAAGAAAAPKPEPRPKPARASAALASRTTAVPFPKPAAHFRLFVFPHAGSGASYYHFLARAMKEDPVELHLVQYPGREMRVKETPLTSMDAMRSTLREELKPLFDDKPFAFFGHSMGALTAFELTRELQASAGPLPRHLFLSGRQAPHIPGPVLDVPKLDDATFLDAVGRRYNALPAELLANREILEIVLPSLRADFTLMERYTHREAPPLSVALTLLNGKEDPWIDENGLRGWERHTTHPVHQHAFAGGHFYLPAAAKELRAIVMATLGGER